MNRRQFLVNAGGLGLSSMLASPHAAARFSLGEGIFNPCRKPLPLALRSHPLVASLAERFQGEQIWDCHVHLFGNGKSGRGIWLNPDFAEPSNPIAAVRKTMFMSGGCIGEDDQAADQRMIDELALRVAELPAGAKAILLAFDATHTEAGEFDTDATLFQVPDSYAARVASAYPDRFRWMASIHPYRADAVAALRRAAELGCVGVKWLPPAMGINLADRRCVPFYEELKRLDIPLLTHVGEEKAVPGAGRYEYANPLYLRRPLDAGVRVIAAHCASAGVSVDLDQPERSRQSVPDFQLWTRLMGEPRYEGRLFGDISALPLISRANALTTLLQRRDWHPRLLNGSDYPLPGVMPLIATRKVAEQGLISEADAATLIEIRKYNALLFDLALKAALRLPGAHKSDTGFARNVFETRSFFERRG
jgi:uncharacterized protein